MTKEIELYACVYAKEFPTQALLRLRPGLRDRPVVVLQGDPPNQQVCSLNTKARLIGMRQGITRVEVETFPSHVALSRCLESEQAAQTVVLECAGTFSPRVEAREHDTSFICVIDITGTSTLFGDSEMLAKSLVLRLRSLGFSVRIAVSANFHAAICLACGLTQTACRMIAPGDEAKMLSPLPIAVLDLTEEQRETFDLWGIHTLGQLAALPEDELAARMGQQAHRLHRLATGRLPHLFQPAELPFVLEEHMDLESPVELLESLLFVLSVMLEQLILRAKERILALACVQISLYLEGGRTLIQTVRPALPTTDKGLWLKLLHLDLEAHPPDAAIVGVRMYAEPGSTSKVQLGLFSPQLPEPGRLNITLARVRALVGEGNVGSAVLQDSNAQEAFTVEPFAVQAGSSSVSEPPHARSAIRMLRPPENVGVTLVEARPAAFFFRGRKYMVEHAFGPWLTSGEWWARTLWGLEQWDVVARLADSSMLAGCMLRDRLRHQWTMAGLYD